MDITVHASNKTSRYQTLLNKNSRYQSSSIERVRIPVEDASSNTTRHNKSFYSAVSDLNENTFRGLLSVKRSTPVKEFTIQHCPISSTDFFFKRHHEFFYYMLCHAHYSGNYLFMRVCFLGFCGGLRQMFRQCVTKKCLQTHAKL